MLPSKRRLASPHSRSVLALKNRLYSLVAKSYGRLPSNSSRSKPSMRQ